MYPATLPRQLPYRSRWQTRITRNGRYGAVEVQGPFGPVYITPRQHMLFVWAGKGRTIRLREVPASIGYSLGGLHRALAQLQKLGLMGHRSFRGRLGRTHLWRNVRTTSSGRETYVYRLLLPVVHGANISPDRVVGSSSPPPGPSFRDLMKAAGWVGSPDILVAE